MLYVRLEIWPGGDAKRRRCIGEASICNMTELAPTSDYSYVLSKEDGFGDARKPAGVEILEAGIVRGHERKRGPWRLLGLVLDQLRGEAK